MTLHASHAGAPARAADASRITRVGFPALFVVLVVGFGSAAAQVSDCGCSLPDICPPTLADIEVLFGRVFEGTYRHGEPYDVLTADPTGTGDSLEALQMILRVHLHCEGGLNVVGMPAEKIILYNPNLCMSWKLADAPTDADGWTSFSGTIAAGGCAPDLQLFAAGVLVARIPIRINSPDHVPASPCAVDASDLSALATRLGDPAQYEICFDYNEDGAVDASDLSFMAQRLGVHRP